MRLPPQGAPHLPWPRSFTPVQATQLAWLHRVACNTRSVHCLSTGESGSRLPSRSLLPPAAHAAPREEDMLSPADVHADMQMDDLMTSICSAVCINAMLTGCMCLKAQGVLTDAHASACP